MKALLAIACAALVVLMALSVPALAHDLRVSALDGGATATAISSKIDYTLQCSNPSCYRVSAAGTAPDCTVDYVLPSLGSKFERDFNGAGGGSIQVRALDAGAPGCQLFQKTK